MSSPPGAKRWTIAVVAGISIVVIVVFVMLQRPERPRVAPSPVARRVGFRDMAEDSGLKFRMTFLNNEQGETFKINLYDHGCGVAVGDYDGDGDDDLYLLNQLGANGLFRNKGDGTFEDVTEETGVALADRISVGATFSDYDNDGDEDLFVTSTRGGNVLFRNEGGGKLVEATEEVGLTHVGHSQTAAFFDYDNDGYLDLYLLNTGQWTTESYDEQSKYFLGKGVDAFASVIQSPKEYNILYHNNRDGTFSDVTEQAGLQGRGWSADLAVFDYDDDGYLDVYVTCMFGPDQLYRNNGDGSFENVTEETLGRTPWGGMGVKAFDTNNDGRLDIYVADMHSDMWMGLDFDHGSLDVAKQAETKKFSSSFGPRGEQDPSVDQLETELADVLDYRREEVLYGNAAFESLDGGRFAEVSDKTGLETFWPWGIATGDFDNDGDEDAFLPSGMGYPFYYWRNYLMMNQGDGTFVDRSREFGVEPPAKGMYHDQRIKGQPSPRSSRCAATGDFDGDGRLELVVNNFNGEAYYYKNYFPRRNYVAFRLRGSQSNRDAIGALVTLHIGTEVMRHQVAPAGGYLSHSTKTVHFGLGDRSKIDWAEVRWPSGATQRLDAPAINQVHRLVEPESST
jgi:hypothetical protein